MLKPFRPAKKKNGYRQLRAVQLPLVVLFLLVAGAALFWLVPQPVLAVASISDAIASALATILNWVLNFIGSLISSILIPVLSQLAVFNDFTGSGAVVQGWKLVRDICNMFFIVMMLVISVGTVLNISSYSYKNFLKKIIFMAILINFSKTIAGALIDVAQIVMLTFVSAFKDSLIVGFAQAFGLNKLTSLGTTVNDAGYVEKDNWSILMGVVFAIVIAAILAIVLIGMIIMLAARIVMLWVLVVLSPFAYLANILPGRLSSLGGQWWKQFTDQLIVGPVIAFFLWLALSVAGSPGGFIGENVDTSNQPTSLIDSSLANASFLMNYVMGILMLIVGMKMAKSMGGAAGAAFGKGTGWAQKYGWQGVKGSFKGVGKSVSWARDASKAFGRKGGSKEYLDKLDQKRDASAARGGVMGTLNSLRLARKIDKYKGREKSRKEAAGTVLKKFGLDGEAAQKTLVTASQIRENKKKNNIKREVVDEVDEEFAADDKLAQVKTDIKTKKAKTLLSGDKESMMMDYYADKEIKVTEEDKQAYREKNPSTIFLNDDLTDDQLREIREQKTKTAWQKLSKKEQGEWQDKFLQDQNNKQFLNAQRVTEEDIEQVKQEEINQRTETKLKDFTYRPRGMSMTAPANIMRYAVDWAKGKQEDRLNMEKLGQVLPANPDAFRADNILDPLNAVKPAAAEAIMKQMDANAIYKQYKHLDDKVNDADTKEKRQKANKARTAWLMGAQFLKGKLSQVDEFLGRLPDGVSVVQPDEKVEALSSVKIEKSKRDFRVDNTDIEKMENTKRAAMEHMMSLGPEETVNSIKGESGWQIDTANSDLDADQVVLKNGDQSQTMTTDQFVRRNGKLMSERFYDSASAKMGSDNFVEKDKFDDYTRIRQSSQYGVTLRAGNDKAAVDFDRLQEVVGDKLDINDIALQGENVNGDEAVIIANGMRQMIEEQKQALADSEDEEQTRQILFDYFGKDTSASGEKLAKIKNETLINADANIANLDMADATNVQTMRENGLRLFNKHRAGGEIRQLYEHETKHGWLDKVDPDKSMRQQAWADMTETDRQAAKDYIIRTRGEGDWTDEEIAGEYLVDALQKRQSKDSAERPPELPQAIKRRFTEAEDYQISEESGSAVDHESMIKTLAGKYVARKNIKQQDYEQSAREQNTSFLNAAARAEQANQQAKAEFKTATSKARQDSIGSAPQSIGGSQTFVSTAQRADLEKRFGRTLSSEEVKKFSGMKRKELNQTIEEEKAKQLRQQESERAAELSKQYYSEQERKQDYLRNKAKEVNKYRDEQKYYNNNAAARQVIADNVKSGDLPIGQLMKMSSTERQEQLTNLLQQAVKEGGLDVQAESLPAIVNNIEAQLDTEDIKVGNTYDQGVAYQALQSQAKTDKKLANDAGKEADKSVKFWDKEITKIDRSADQIKTQAEKSAAAAKATTTGGSDTISSMRQESAKQQSGKRPVAPSTSSRSDNMLATGSDGVERMEQRSEQRSEHERKTDTRTQSNQTGSAEKKATDRVTRSEKNTITSSEAGAKPASPTAAPAAKPLGKATEAPSQPAGNITSTVEQSDKVVGLLNDIRGLLNGRTGPIAASNTSVMGQALMSPQQFKLLKKQFQSLAASIAANKSSQKVLGQETMDKLNHVNSALQSTQVDDDHDVDIDLTMQAMDINPSDLAAILKKVEEQQKKDAEDDQDDDIQPPANLPTAI